MHYNLLTLTTHSLFSPIRLFAACSLWLAAISISAQEYDTLSNWDGIAPYWTVSTSGTAGVQNPSPGEVNPSAHCYKFITGTGEYDYMYTLLDEPANFNTHPRYKLKVLAPATGGDITLKFENYNNSSSQEIVLTPVPGQWTDLEYDFSGLPYNEYIRMVIFPDFGGTQPGNAWHIDDVLREKGEDPGPLQLDSNLPIIVIDTYGQPIEDEPKITAEMGIIYNGPGERNNLQDPFNDYNGYIGIEKRGQSSQMFPKTSFAVETRDSNGENLNVSLLGLPEENDWVLYAPYSDKSMLRNIVSFELYRMMGNYGSRSVFCEVVINGEYKGVYTLMEKIKQDDNRVDIAGLNPDEILGDNLTGGYIIKVDKIDWDFQYNIDGWRSNPSPAYPNAMDITFQYFSPAPDEIVPEQRAYIREFITTAENALTLYTFSNPYLGYHKYFDVLSFVDMMLLNEIGKEVDKYRYSTYFYKDKDSKGGKLFAGPPWDFDLGYGNVNYWEPGLDHTGWMYQMVEPVEWGIMFWWKRLMEDEYFRDLAKSRWVWLRERQLSDENIHTLIDSVITRISEGRERNYERWPILGEYVWPNYDWEGNDYDDEVDYFEDFLFNRVAWMDSHLYGNLISPQAGISAEGNKLTVRLYGDYFADHDLDNDNFTLNHVPAGTEVQGAVFLNASEAQLTITGDISASDDLTVTISEKEINYWLDITSTPLSAAGIADELPGQTDISISARGNQLLVFNGYPQATNVKADVYNLSGQKVLSAELAGGQEKLIPHNLRPGIYLLVITNENERETVKFQVQ